MQSKLTLRLDKAVIENAKAYAHEHGKSLSQIVSDYFSALTMQHSEDGEPQIEIGPLTASLLGSCSELNYSDDTQLREEYIDYLEAKHS